MEQEFVRPRSAMDKAVDELNEIADSIEVDSAVILAAN